MDAASSVRGRDDDSGPPRGSCPRARLGDASAPVGEERTHHRRPGAAGVLSHDNVIGHIVVAFVAFCASPRRCTSSTTCATSRLTGSHPTKRFRAIAVGPAVPGLAIAAAVAPARRSGSPPVHHLAARRAAADPRHLRARYALYILWLKNVADHRAGLVASGFFLRAYAGAAACHISVSSWFLVVVSFGALFLVVGQALQRTLPRWAPAPRARCSPSTRPNSSTRPSP